MRLLCALLTFLPVCAVGAEQTLLVYEVRSTGKASIDRELTLRCADILRRRAASLGLSVMVSTQADHELAVAVPESIKDPKEILKPLLKPARLELRLKTPPWKVPKNASKTGEDLRYEYIMNPETKEISKQPHWLHKRVLMTGTHIQTAEVASDRDTGQPDIFIHFNAEGTRKLEQVSREALGQMLVLLVDGNVVSAAVIREPIVDGVVMISSRLSPEEASDLARAFNSGPLPADLKLLAPEKFSSTSVAAGAPSVFSDVDEALTLSRPRRPKDFAVVIGVESYRQELPKAEFAQRDAEAFARYLTKTLGYPDENVILLTNEHAARSDLDKYLEVWLAGKAGPDSSVLVYYSGHGAPDPSSGETFLVPYDGDPAFLERTAYPIKRLYETLARLPARRAVVILDACFSGAGGRSVLAKGARPLVIKRDAAALPAANIAVMTASTSEQISSVERSQDHGLFTYFLLKTLKASSRVERPPTLKELFETTKPLVEASSRRLSHNEQTPTLKGLEPQLGAPL